MSNDPTPIKMDTIVVRGTGSIGRRHLRVFGDLEGTRVVAWPVHAARRVELEAAGIEVIDGLEQLDRPPAGIVIATDTGRHVDDIVVLCGRAPCLVEKPLATSLADLDRATPILERFADRTWVAFPLRFDPSLGRVRQTLSGLGRIYSVRVECQSYLPDWRPDTDHRQGYAARAVEGGVLRDLAHEIDYALWLFGVPSTVQAVLASTGTLEIEAEESADLLWVVPGGPQVSLRLDYLSRVPRRRMSVVAERGVVEWDGLAQSVRIVRPDNRIEELTAVATRDSVFAALARAFLAGARGEAIDPRLATFADGARAVAVSDAARRANASGTGESV